MGVWERISDATKVPRPDFGGAKAGLTAKAKGMPRLGPWAFIGGLAFVVWAIWSGIAASVLTQFELQLLKLLPLLAVDLVLVSIFAVLVGGVAWKFPRNHFVAVYGRRLLILAPVVLVIGAALMPVALEITTLAQTESTKLSAAYLGQKPAANLCQAMQSAAPAPQLGR